MENSEDIVVTLSKLIVDFFSENMIYIAFLCFVYIFRESLGGLISRLTSLTWKKGDAEVGLSVEADMAKKVIEDGQMNSEASSDISNGRENLQEGIEGEPNPILESIRFLQIEDIESARKSFDDLLQQEKDPKKIKYYEVWFLFFFIQIRKNGWGD